MAVPTSPAGRRPRLADRLAAARRRRFVGREAELALFAAALADPEPPFALVYVHGPGGVGKTVLLGGFARLADEAGVPAVRLDGRDLDPSPPGFLAALGRALHEPPDASPLEALARRPRGVLMVDTYETLGPLDAWLRETLLPELPAGTWSCWPAATGRRRAGWPTPAGGTSSGWCRCATCARPRARPTSAPAASRPPSTRPCCRSPTATPWPCRWSPTWPPAAATRPPWPRAAAGRGPGATGAVRGAAPRGRPPPGPRACAHVRVTTEGLLASADEDLHAPALLDFEVASALRGHVLGAGSTR
jgi:hypothetical protein